MPRSALIACVHGNLEALTSVLADIDRRGIKDVLFLGDAVGYGPDPEACIDLLRARCRVALQGHADEALFCGTEFWTALHAAHTVTWTRERMTPGVEASAAVHERWRFLQELGTRHEEGARLFVHGSPRDPVHEYILEGDLQPGGAEKLASIFGSFGALLFTAHTHIPGVITDERVFLRPDQLKGRFKLRPDRRAIVNVGAVGQPRDRDPRACYATLRGNTVEWHRVAYGVGRTCSKVLDAGFDKAIANGLAAGR